MDENSNPFLSLLMAQLRNKMQLPSDNTWDKHGMRDAELFERYKEFFGGYDRRAKDAKGFHSAADAAIRWPDTSTGLWNLLAGAYQASSPISALMQGQFGQWEPKEEYKDYEANKAGVALAKKLIESGIPKEQWEDLLYQGALQYADPFGDTTK